MIWVVAADYPAAELRFLDGTADSLDVVKPERVAEVIERSLAKDPGQRWQSAAAMRTALMHAA